MDACLAHPRVVQSTRMINGRSPPLGCLQAFSQGAGGVSRGSIRIAGGTRAAAGAPPSWVAKNELGERRIDPIELAEIAVALGESPRAIFQIVEDTVAIFDENKTKR